VPIKNKYNFFLHKYNLLPIAKPSTAEFVLVREPWNISAQLAERRGLYIYHLSEQNYKKSVMMDNVPFQIKDFGTLNCLLITTNLFYTFLSVSQFRVNHINIVKASHLIEYNVTSHFTKWRKQEKWKKS